jgi:hypothetical protein
MLNFIFSLFFLEKIKKVINICKIKSATHVLQTKSEKEFLIFNDVLEVESIQFKNKEINPTVIHANTIFFDIVKFSHFSLNKSIACINCLLTFLLFALSLYSIILYKK